MPYTDEVYRIKIEADEDGFFHLVIECEALDMNLVLPHDQALALIDECAQIAEWQHEREAARKGIRVFKCNPDESGGYDTSDPKHPDYHSIHADIYDNREKV